MFSIGALGLLELREERNFGDRQVGAVMAALLFGVGFAHAGIVLVEFFQFHPSRLALLLSVLTCAVLGILVTILGLHKWSRVTTLVTV